MASIRTPKTLSAAPRLCERFAEVDGAIADIEERRRAALAKVNAEADAEAHEMVAERDAIRAKLSSWWPDNANELTDGKRKSIELGGCKIGSRSAAESLLVDNEDAAIVALKAVRWAAPLLQTKVFLNRREILKALDGGYAVKLAAMGLSRKPAEEGFVLERVAQGGTLAGRR